MTSTTDSPRPAEAGVEERRRRLAEMLGLDEPVPEEVLVAATYDETYARNLFASRAAAPLLEHLMANPPAVERPSAAALARRATEAFGRWGRSGFARVDGETYERRVARCMQCPYLMEPDDHRQLYRAVAGSDRPKVCGACGCVVAMKASRRSEQCPVDDPDRPGWSLWGEPRKKASPAPGANHDD